MTTHKYVPSLAEISGKIAGSTRHVDNEIDRIQEEVTRTKNVSDKTILEVLNLLRVMADTQINFAADIATYDNYLRKKHGIDTAMFIGFEE
jgi:hypothetical protein